MTSHITNDDSRFDQVKDQGLASERRLGGVGRVVVVAFNGDTRYYGFTVETSLDGQTWDMVADRRDNKELSTAEGYTCRFEPRPVRYLRVTQTHNSANTGRHLVEVMAFEE